MIKTFFLQIFLGKKLKFLTSLARIALYPQLPGGVAALEQKSGVRALLGGPDS